MTMRFPIFSRAKAAEGPCAVVIGLDSMTGIQTARILARHGVPVIGIARNPAHHCCRTNVCREILVARTQSDELVDTLTELSERLQHKAVLYPCLDQAVRVISRRRDSLQESFHIALPSPEAFDMLTDKGNFYAYAKENGFPVPATFVVHDPEEAKRAAHRIRYPGLVKPAKTSPRWHRHTLSKAYRVDSAEEFLALYQRCETWTDALILQEWIEGGDDSLYSFNGYFDAQSDELCTFVARKIRQWPPHIGYSSLGMECRNDVVLQESLRLFRSVGYSGLGYVEFKRDARTGKHFIIEPNIGRPTGRSAIAEAGGVEILYAMYCDLLGLPLPANRTQKYIGTKWIDLRHDFQSALYYWRKGELSLLDWWRSWRGPKAYAYFSWRDPAPFIRDLRNALWRATSAKERKKRDYLSNGRNQAKPSGSPDPVATSQRLS